MKPLGKKSYGSIPHLFGSKLGEGDHHCHEGLPLLAQPARINSTRPKLCASAESTSWRMNLAAIFPRIFVARWLIPNAFGIAILPAIALAKEGIVP